MKAILLSFLAAAVAGTAGAAEPATLHDKTLVAWVAPANLDQRGGSVLTLDGLSGSFLAASRAELLSANDTATPSVPAVTPEDLVLNYHLMHPGGDSAPGDPNAAYYLDGTYHLHYILGHSYRGRQSFSFVHVTSPDMLHWTWQPTKLQPSFTGHGMFSGTGFITKEGKPAAIYHGQGSGHNQIAIARDRQLSAWEKPYAVQVRNADGTEAKMDHWDPDCFLIGDTYSVAAARIEPGRRGQPPHPAVARVGNAAV